MGYVSQIEVKLQKKKLLGPITCLHLKCRFAFKYTCPFNNRMILLKVKHPFCQISALVVTLPSSGESGWGLKDTRKQVTRH